MTAEQIAGRERATKIADCIDHLNWDRIAKQWADLLQAVLATHLTKFVRQSNQ